MCAAAGSRCLKLEKQPDLGPKLIVGGRPRPCLLAANTPRRNLDALIAGLTIIATKT